MILHRKENSSFLLDMNFFSLTHVILNWDQLLCLVMETAGVFVMMWHVDVEGYHTGEGSREQREKCVNIRPYDGSQSWHQPVVPWHQVCQGQWCMWPSVSTCRPPSSSRTSRPGGHSGRGPGEGGGAVTLGRCWEFIKKIRGSVKCQRGEILMKHDSAYF